MLRFTHLSFVIILCILFCPTLLEAQSHRISGRIVQSISKDPLAFAHLIINKGENHAFADINGDFLLESDQALLQLTVKHPLHNTVTIALDSVDTDSLVIHLTANQLFVYEQKTDEGTYALMDKVFANKKLYNPNKMRDLSYESYNKFTLSYGQVKRVKSIVNKLLGKFKSINKTIDSTQINQHLFMMESATKQEYFNRFNHKESVLASKVSGIEQPAMFALTSQLQPLSIYEPETYLLGKHYNSPFTHKPFRWYYFKIIDTAYINQDTIYVVKFNPRNDAKILFLKGYLYINTNGYAVQYHHVSPAIEGSVEMDYQQSYKQGLNDLWFPYQIQTAIIKDRLSTQNNKLKAIDRTTLYHLNRNVGLKKRKFNEIVLDYKDNQTQPNEFWQKHRKQKFTTTDSLTYLFYDSVGSIKNFENFIRLGEGLYYGEVPFKNVDLLLSRVLDFNQFEGIRLGLGLQTNERLFKHATLGGYWARGLKDDESKYGIYTRIKLGKFLNTRLWLAYQSDLYESGDVELPFDYQQFSSESLRGYRVSITDRIIRYEFALEFQPIKYINMRLGFYRDDVSPLYEYDLEGLVDDFDFAEFRLGMRYAFGEHYMASVHRKISFGTDYPVAWFQVTKGYNGFLGGEFDYTKWDFKLQKTTRTVALGTSYVQIRAGWIKGRVPYQRLYRGRGSFRRISTIARNSFETMGYNEFLSDRYLALFYSHNLGDIYIRRLRKQPSLVVSQNMGWGSLKKSERHNQFNFKTMEKGYFESGAFLNNVLVINGFGIHMGLGAGLFVRYGPYQFPTAKENLVVKIAVDFQL